MNMTLSENGFLKFVFSAKIISKMERILDFVLRYSGSSLLKYRPSKTVSLSFFFIRRKL